jgi:4-hydroxybenzoate polyprenyltransferase
MDRGEGMTLGRSFTEKVDALSEWLEKDRLNLWQTFLYVALVALARDLSEYFLLDQAFVGTPHPWIFSIAHHVAFFILTYLGLVIILKVFSGSGLRRCINYTNCYYWIIIIPPWIDHFIFGQSVNYAYFSWTDFLAAFFLLGGDSFHPGQGIEVIVVLFALFAYVFWRHRGDLVDVQGRGVLALRLGGMAIFTVASMFVLGTPGTYLPVGSEAGIPVFPNFDSTRYVQFHMFIFSYFYMASVILVLALSFIALHGRFWKERGALRPYQTAFFTAIVAAGIAFGWQSSGGGDLIIRILDRPFWVNIAYALPIVVTAVLAWQVSVIWNDLSDRHWDSPLKRGRVLASGLIPPRMLQEVSAVLAIVVLGVSLLLSVQQFMIMAAILGMAFVYSFSPVRFKKALLSPLLIGMGAFLAFLYGASAPYSEIGTVGGIAYLTGEVIEPALVLDTVVVGAFMFIGLVVGSMITDVDGYQEDAAGKVRTIYTVFGLEKGAGYVSLLILLSALAPLALFNDLLDLLVFPALGIGAAIRCKKRRSSTSVMPIALVGMIYAALRFLGTL